LEAAQDAIVVGATDVEWKALGNSRFEIVAGARKFVVEAKGEKGERLRHVVTRVVPRLSRSATLREQLPAAEAERLLPHVKSLAAMGVLLYPREPITTDAELRLYSFIARRSTAPDEVFASLRREITVTGPARVTDAFAEGFTRQGLRVRDPQDAQRTRNTATGLAVVVSLHDEAVLQRANRELCAARRPFLPVLVTPARIRIGPWTMPGESACLHCSAPGGATAADASLTGVVARDSWPTLQSGSLGWAAGLTAQLALRAFLPMGPEHPWGRIVTLDPVACEQSTVRAWRDPYCASCATAAPVAQEWLEV
jgi:hypothetical protein